MIRALFVGMARVAFGLAVTAFVVAGVLVWFSFRMIRRAFRAEDAPADTRTALFGLLVAVVALARTLNIQPPGAYDARRSDLVREPAE
jgi:hypothetical protein